MQVVLFCIYKIISIIWLRLSCIFATYYTRTILWINGVEFGNGIRSMKTNPDIVISKSSRNVRIGNNVTFNNFGDQSWYCKCKIMVRENASLIIGNNVGLNGVLLFVSNSIRIGDNVKIGGGARIFDTDHHSLDYTNRRNDAIDNQNTVSKPIVIEEDAFIGTGCTICKGVVIGPRSIVAAGSVVVKSIPSDEVWGGNPAKFIRKI